MLGVVFVHGVRSSALAWDAFAGVMANDEELLRMVAEPVPRFGYSTGAWRSTFKPLTVIPSVSTAADSLKEYLITEASGFDRLVLVGHSQGGLVIQRCLVRMLSEGRGLELARIARVVLLATPNTGSELLLTLRRALVPGNSQERGLRPFDELVSDTLRVIVRDIVNAPEVPTQRSCRIPFSVYAGEADAVVTRASAQATFPEAAVLPGNHFTIAKPDSSAHRTYTTVRRLLLEAAAEGPSQPVAMNMVTSSGPTRVEVHDAADVATSRPSQVLEQGFDSPIQDVRRRVLVEEAGKTPEWDFFISHAGEDKLLVAGPLAHYLQSVGFSVWYDEFSLRVGDSVLREIDRGLGASRYGVVILSESFFAKQWPRRELAGLIATASDGERRVLPVWHGVDAAAVAAHSPLLADVKAVNTSRGLHVVAEEIVRAAFPERLATLPLSNGSNERAADRETARKTLLAVLDAGGSREDVLLVLSAYQSLLTTLTRYGAEVMIPASRFAELPCDFILYEPHGVTGPIQVTFVVLGPTGTGGADFLAATDLAFGDEIQFAGRPRNDYLPGRRVGEFPSVLSEIRRLADHIKSGNIHHRHPELWNFSVLLFHGRRGAQDAVPAVPTRLHFETASYDRLTDS